jgi:hypothetical protein
VIALITNPNSPDALEELRDVQNAAKAIGQELLVVPATSDRDFEVAFASIVQHRDGSLSVLVGRHGAMNPAGKVRCNMGTKYGWLTTIATFTGSKPGFCYPRLGHDALRLRPGKL